jgi:DNA-binding transcriptional LysR family regulator
VAINELRSITTFMRAAELGSLRKAAGAQDISPQAASQALAQLEQHLGVRLFHRTTRVMTLTDEGQRFLEEARPALLGLQRALQTVRLAKDEIAGPLRIVGPRSAFAPLLWPLLDEFCDRHPGIVPDVVLDDRVGNWVEDRVDVGFRLGASPHPGVIARRLLPVQMVVCASPAYLDRHGAPNNLADLSLHRLSAYRHPGTGQVLPWRAKVGQDTVDIPVAPTMCVNDELLELQAVLAGKVIGQLAGITAAPHIRAGHLVPLLPEYMPDYASYFVYFGSRESQPARARAFIDLAVDRLANNPAWLLTSEELRHTTRTRAKGRRLSTTEPRLNRISDQQATSKRR